MTQLPQLPRPLTDETLDAVARALIPSLDRVAAKAFELPEETPARCPIDRKRAPWIALCHYLAGTEAKTATVNLCSDHADRWHQEHRAGRLRYLGHQVFRFTLTQRASA